MACIMGHYDTSTWAACYMHGQVSYIVMPEKMVCLISGTNPGFLKGGARVWALLQTGF